MGEAHTSGKSTSQAPLSIILAQPVISAEKYGRQVGLMKGQYSLFLNQLNGTETPKEIRTIIESLDSNIGELESLMNGNSPIQRADVVYVINPILLQDEMKLLSEYSGNNSEGNQND